jgi:putative membrane protein
MPAEPIARRGSGPSAAASSPSLLSRVEAELPDPRVLQANERTLLAWLRTGVGLMAFGFVLSRAGSWLSALGGATAHDGKLAWVGVIFVAIGTGSCGLAARQYVRIQRLLLGGEPVRPTHLAPLLAVVLLAMGVTLGVLLALDLGG